MKYIARIHYTGESSVARFMPGSIGVGLFHSYSDGGAAERKTGSRRITDIQANGQTVLTHGVRGQGC